MQLLTANNTTLASQFAASNNPFQIDVGPQCAPSWRAGASIEASAVIQPTTANQTGFLYKNSATAGQSGQNEPAWPTIADETVIDGSLTWTASVPPVAGADEVASAIWSQVNPPDNALVIGNKTTTDRAALADVSGGTAGNTYTIEVALTMQSGAIYVGKCLLTIM